MTEEGAGARNLTGRIEAARDDLVALTRDLIRMPTLNPPGDCYLEICELIGRRLEAHGFEIRLLRAEGSPGDSDRYPRWNVARPARRSGQGTVRPLQLPHGRRRDRPRLDLRSVRRHGCGRPDIWPRRLRHEGRSRRLDHRRRGLHRDVPGLLRARSRSPARPTRRPAATAGSRGWPNRAFSTPTACSTSSYPSRSTRIASASVTAASGGPRSRPTAASPTAPCRFSAIARSATWAR